MFWDCFEGDIQPDLSLCEDEDVFVLLLACVFLFIPFYQKAGIPGKFGFFRKVKFYQRA